MPKTLSIVGPGRVGKTLGRRLRELGWKIGIVSARTSAGARKSVQFIGGGRPYVGITSELTESRAILLTVPDDAIALVADELARVCGASLRGRVVLHTSGALESGVLGAARDCGAQVGSMHPLQTFSGVSNPALEGRVFAIEGDEGAVRLARSIARAVGGIPHNISKAKKTLYHAAAAFASGHILALEETGVQMLMSTGMRRQEAVRALVSLTRQMLSNYENFGVLKSWTGPLARGDFGVVTSHEEMLAAQMPEFLQTYQVLCAQAARVLSPDPEALLGELDKVSANVYFSQKAKGETT